MIRYTVVWHDVTQGQLAQIWLDAVDRDDITRATHEIDAHLATDTETKGMSIVGDLREWSAPPLRVLFSVSGPDRLVKVLYVAKVGVA